MSWRTKYRIWGCVFLLPLISMLSWMTFDYPLVGIVILALICTLIVVVCTMAGVFLLRESLRNKGTE